LKYNTNNTNVTVGSYDNTTNVGTHANSVVAYTGTFNYGTNYQYGLHNIPLSKPGARYTGHWLRGNYRVEKDDSHTGQSLASAFGTNINSGS
jgi:hypothetical protein